LTGYGIELSYGPVGREKNVPRNRPSYLCSFDCRSYGNPDSADCVSINSNKEKIKMPNTETKKTILFKLKGKPKTFPKIMKCEAIFHEEEEKQVMVRFDKECDEITIDIEAGSTAVAAVFDLEQAVDLRQQLDELIDRMAKA